MVRGTPEQALREEAAALRAQLNETNLIIERERQQTAAAELEKEHYRYLTLCVPLPYLPPCSTLTALILSLQDHDEPCG